MPLQVLFNSEQEFVNEMFFFFLQPNRFRGKNYTAYHPLLGGLVEQQVITIKSNLVEILNDTHLK